MKRIGILGGSFNPVHEGHLALAEAARRELDLDRVIFVPAAASPLKDPRDLLPQARRMALLRRALRGRPHFRIDPREMRRPGPSYTVDTLRALKRKFGRSAVLYFVCGADAARTLSRWKSPAEVLQLCRFAVANRPGYARPKRLRPGMVYFNMPPVGVSSSEIRRANGGPPFKRKTR